MLLVSSAKEENWTGRGVRVMVALRKEFGVAPDAISGIATAAHSATLAPMQTLDINATHPWLILRIFTDDTAGKVRRLCASPDGPHDVTGRFDFVLANPPFNKTNLALQR